MKISVITATYNSEKLIERCLQSVHDQTVECEHIIIDGCSTDKTNLIVQNKKRTLDRHIIEKDNGIYDALNKGIKNATGDIIAILNSDDYFASVTSLEAILEQFKSGAEIVYGGTQYRTSLGKIGAVYIPTKFSGPGSFLKGWHPPHPSFYALKSCYDKSGSFLLELPVASDFELMFRFFEVNRFKSFWLPFVLVNMDPGGYSSTWKNRFIGFYDIKKSFHIHGQSASIWYFLKRYSAKVVERYKW
jgi:glycosyltransferase involved in cell wall biosynthesis